MKQKLTIAVDAELVTLARRYAKSRDTSLSDIIEQVLREITNEEKPTFTRKWRGKFEAAERMNDQRYEALAAKYLP